MNQNKNTETFNNIVAGEHFMAARLASLVMPNMVTVERVTVEI